MSVRATSAGLLFITLCALGCAHPAPTAAGRAATAQGPRWERELMVWRADEEKARTWREDPRLQGRFHAEEPDDIQVVFLGPESDERQVPEVMWVTVIAHDTASDTFLGILLNSPHHLKDVQEGDNVLFRAANQDIGRQLALVALAPGPSRLGWPHAAPGSFLETLTRGVRHYRQGRFGHHPPGIQACIDTLGPVLEPAAQDVPADQRQLGHFVLARCLAEKYETLRAVRHFEEALRLDPKDAHARMGLLAELSLLAHLPREKLESGAEAEWEQRYLAQVAETRKLLQGSSTLRMLDILFSEEQLEADPAQDSQLREKRHRVGAGPFRYKVR